MSTLCDKTIKTIYVAWPFNLKDFFWNLKVWLQNIFCSWENLDMRQHTFDDYQRTTKTILMYQQYDEVANIQARILCLWFQKYFSVYSSFYSR